MTWNPLKTLTGRMVLVTVIAVAASHAAAFQLYANERNAALRRAVEGNAIERIVITAERLQAAPADRRAAIAHSIRDFRTHYELAAAPSVAQNTGGRAARVARALSAELAGAEVRASERSIEHPSHRWREPREPQNQAAPPRARAGAPASHRFAHHAELNVSVRLDTAQWLNVRTHLPGPRPLPLSALAGAIASVLLVGVGAALVSRQIGRPLAQLAAAARAFGAGQADAAAPVAGPEDVRRAAAAFNLMAQRLARQLSRQRQMLWALSHDLRTPITAIRLRAELIDDENARRRLLAPLAEMESLTEQALALARAGASEEPRSVVDLSDIARTLCGELQDLSLNVRAEADAPVMAACRPSEIARALRNLAENAAKHGGGGVMRVYRNDSNNSVVEVIDEGPGVPDDLIVKLAAPFFRADESRASPGGAGLGLAIAQAIAEAHGGALVLKNLVPRGFSAAFVLPESA